MAPRVVSQPSSAGRSFPSPDLTGLPPEVAQLVESTQQQTMVITAGMVGMNPLNEHQRRSLLAEIDVRDALAQVADIHSRWDLASTTHWDVMPLQLDLLVSTSADWTPAVRAEVNNGNVLTPPQVTVQLMRELMETDPSSTSWPMTAEDLVHLLVSIATEQPRSTEFDADTPSDADFAALDARYQAMDPDDLHTLLREFLTTQNAGMLFNAPNKIEVLKADIWDFWYSPWAARASDTLGDRPADAFTMATGIEFDDCLRAGMVITDAAAAGHTIVALDDLSADPQVRDFITANMVLDLASYRAQLAADRARGDIGLQRYTFTRYPLLNLEDGTLLILRSQWAIERFLGDPAQFDVMAAFENGGDTESAKRFNEGVKYQF